MYQLKSGKWKSDFKMNKERYQQTWETDNEMLALRYENEWKSKIRANQNLQGGAVSLQNPMALDWMMMPQTTSEPMSLTEAKEWMYERKWKMLKDSKNPQNRMDKIIRYFGDIQVSTLTTDSISVFRQYLLEHEGKANKTVNHYMGVLKTTLELLIASDRVDMKMPHISSLTLPRVGERVVCFTRAEEEQMFNTLKKAYTKSQLDADYEMLHYFIIQASLGLRPAELLYMPINCVHFKSNRVMVKYAEHGDTKNGVVRTLPIGGNVKESFMLLVLKRLESLLRGTHVEELGTTINKGTLFELIEGKESSFLEGTLELLLERYSNPRVRVSPIISLSMKMVQTRWLNMKRELGWINDAIYRDYVPYGLRHTVASRLAGDRGFNAHQIMSFMGHKDIATSMKYVHLNVTHLEDAVYIGNDALKL